MSHYPKRYEHRLSMGPRTNALVLLIAINMIMYVALAFIHALYHLFSQDQQVVNQLFRERVLRWVELPGDAKKLLQYPWTVLSYGFSHDNIWRVIPNMLWLWFFGYILQDLTGNRKLIPVYIYGVLGGAAAFIAACQLIPSVSIASASLIGCSTGIAAVAAAVTTIAPGFRLFPLIKGGIPLWVLTVIYAVVVVASVPMSNPAELIAHVGGALTGVLFILLLRRGYDGSDWMNRFFDWINDLFNPDKPKKGASIKEELFYKSPQPPFKRTPNVTQQRIDEILDKINQKGYEYLTEDEKELLKRAAKEDK
ncbi:rhomboid family intramembrane serine protease [Terrimonas ferruginea]|uniref:rhomboid family intramembrane serine protease n=1 Tax=Terrimonas ferruginea TaxID=249 RepID=UPI00042799F1|nr:rhomboid family intramembrane serine protease [Terrimonas ferruginea]